MRLEHFLCLVEEPFTENLLPYKKLWSQRPNTSTFLLLASVLLLQIETAVPTEMDRHFWCKSELLLNFCLDYTEENVSF